MPTYEDHPKIGKFKHGSDFIISFNVHDADGNVVDYTGATVSCVLVPKAHSDTAVTITGALDANPAAIPQFSVTVTDTQSATFTPDQDIDFYATITKSGGLIDIASGQFKLLRGGAT